MEVENINTNSNEVIRNPKINEVKKTEPKTEPYPNDSLDLSKKNKKKKHLSLFQKTIFGVAAAIVATSGIALLIIKHQGNRIKKLYDEKLVISNLKEKIDFTDAKTVEEGIKFAKEVLGIKEVDSNFTLEAINVANKGLVDVINANKGKVFMPHALRYTTPKDKHDYIAAVQMNINSKEFGNLYINGHYFDEKFLDNELRKELYNNKVPLFEFDENIEPVVTPIWEKYIYANPSKEVAKLINSYCKNSSSISLSQKRDLLYSLIYGRDEAARTFRNPQETLDHIQETQKEFLEKNSININYDMMFRLGQKEQTDYLISILEKMSKEGIYLVKNFRLSSPLKTIYHEMGHLQDAAKNLKELDLKQWKFDWKAEWHKIINRHEYSENTNRVGVDEVDNRWGSIWTDYYKDLLAKEPIDFKMRYPDFYEFINDEHIQQTVGKVSSYSQSGIGEFIAETYSKMIGKQKIPDDVMELYRKYNGPELP